MATMVEVLVTDEQINPCPESPPSDPCSVRGYLLHCGHIIRAARKALGLTCKALGEQVGLSESHISHIETGEAIPRLVKLLEILAYVQIPIPYPFVPVPSPALHELLAIVRHFDAPLQAAILGIARSHRDLAARLTPPSGQETQPVDHETVEGCALP